jgi:uncharacterized protein (DUF58 family)
VWVGRRLVALTAGAAVVSALLVAATGVLVPVVVGVNLAILAAAFLDVRRAPQPAALGVARTAPPVVGIRRTERVTVTLHNPTSRRMWVSVRDATPPSLHRKPPAHRIALEPGRWAELHAEIRPERRGRLSIGPVTVRTAGPLGLGGRQATLPLESVVSVYPALPGRAEVELRLTRARLLQSGERSSAVRGGGTEFDSVREYHPDDEFRRINWRATARAARPISNIYREERNQQVMLLLDAGRLMAGSVEGVSRFEYAIDAAMAVAELAARVGDHVGMLAFGRDVEAMVAPRSGRGHPRLILETLFALEPRLDAPNYRRAFSTLLARHRRRSLIVLLTELGEVSAMESLFEALPALAGRHLLLVGAVTDPALEAAAAAIPSDSAEVYLKAAAAEAVEARESAAARLSRMGAVVVDLPPGRLAGRLADEYLRIKAHGRL